MLVWKALILALSALKIVKGTLQILQVGGDLGAVDQDFPFFTRITGPVCQLFELIDQVPDFIGTILPLRLPHYLEQLSMWILQHIGQSIGAQPGQRLIQPVF